SLPNGTYNFSTVTADVAGNVSDRSQNFKLVLGKADLKASKPKLTASSILGTAGDGTPITTGTPTFTGTAKPGYTVTIVDGNTILGTVVADASGKWSFTSPLLAKGKHQIQVEVTNLLGETSLLSDILTIQV